MKKANSSFLGFTLIELLVVVTIIGVLLGLSLIGLQGARESSRDTKRRADLELIRSGLELYRADCGDYPGSLTPGAQLKGDGSPTTCSASNIYIEKVPTDPTSTARSYPFVSSGTPAVNYTLCAALEQAPSPAQDITGCGSCTATCNYKTTQP